ncbi:MAG: hypothetical protein EXQ88_00610 [Alphaproteobacteria bacterium]|nr:hypothetical protein [Alphaproteobacteria bacterium]
MRKSLLAIIASVLLTVLPVAAQQRPGARGAGPQGGPQVDDVQPLNAVLQGLRGRITGRILDANLSAGQGGRSIYIVRTLERDGRERVFTIDARSGEVLGERGGR